MRKDSEIFLKKLLEYKQKIGKNNFEVNYTYFKEIPSIDTAIYDILKDLIANNCLTSKSQMLNLEGDISINLTLDGITYFDSNQEKKSPVIFNVSGGQVNIANDNGKIEAVIGNADLKEEKKLPNITEDAFLQSNKTSEYNKTVFISYSWVPDSNKEWVRGLAKRLEQDGVSVVIDYKDLKLGHDKYAFMERIVADKTIDKVLIICNKSYKGKSDGRKGGVGDESAIITPQVYGNAKQEKFIPVVNEHDENGHPYLPNYLASRMYADLTDFEKGYKELLDNILGTGERDGIDKTEEIPQNDIDDFDSSTTFFEYRFRKAFPGVRGMKEFTDPKECVDRLEILLREPLHKKDLQSPIWWFRGNSNLYIHKFKRLSKTKFLMNFDEIEVKRIVVYSAPEYYKTFVYVETYPEKTTGLYGDIKSEDIASWIEWYGEYHEEYAVYNGRNITRQEYDDGAAVIDGKVVDVEGKAELRIRYLTTYNFLICAQFNPINESKHDRTFKEILNGILRSANTVDEIIEFIDGLGRHRKDI